MPRVSLQFQWRSDQGGREALGSVLLVAGSVADDSAFLALSCVRDFVNNHKVFSTFTYLTHLSNIQALSAIFNVVT